MNIPRFSVLLLTARRGPLLKRAIDSIANEYKNGISEGLIEVIVVINDLGDLDSIKIVDTSPIVSKKIVIARTHPGAARNHGIQAAQGSWIFFLDDDAYLPTNAWTQLTEVVHRYPNAAAIGGPNLTPPDASAFQNATGKVLRSIFGTVFSNARFKKDYPERRCGEEALMLCNLLVRKDRLINHSLVFDLDLSCNEENLLLQRLKARKEEIYYCPEFYAFHERRPDFISFSRQVSKYGTGRAENSCLNPESLRMLHLIPAIFFIYFVLWTLLAFAFAFNALPVFPIVVFGSPLFLYASLVMVFSWLVQDIRALLLFPLIHFSYGWGFIKGLFTTGPSILRHHKKTSRITESRVTL